MLIYVEETLPLPYIFNRVSILLVPSMPRHAHPPIRLLDVLFPLGESLNFKSVEFVEARTVDLGEFRVMVLFGDPGNDILFLEPFSWKFFLGFLNPRVENLMHCFKIVHRREIKKEEDSKDDGF